MLRMDMDKSKSFLVLSSRLVFSVNQHFHSSWNPFTIPVLWGCYNDMIRIHRMEWLEKCLLEKSVLSLYLRVIKHKLIE